MNSRFVALSAALVLVAPAPALASSMPRADFAGTSPTIGLGVGSGNLSGSFDVPITRDWQLGLGGSRLNPVGANVDLRGLWRFWNAGANPCTLALLAGVQADGNTFGALGNFEPMVGLAAAYPITALFTIRANLVVAGRVVPGTPMVNWRPAGIELAYRFTPTMELTAGANGRGDILGLKLNF